MCAPSTSYGHRPALQCREGPPALRSGRRAVRRRQGLRCYAHIEVSDLMGPDLGWPMDFRAHYVKGKLIGTGSFGTVYLGIDLHSGREVAIKTLPKVRGKLTKEKTLQKLIKEVHINERLQDCPNVVRLEACFEEENEVLLVTELCKGGDLQKLSDDQGCFSERSLALVAYEVLKVMAAAHSKGILHGDIKPANFVLASRNRNPLLCLDPACLAAPWLKAIDFGCSQFLDAGGGRFSKRSGTPMYMAPEVFERDYGYEADVWSLGMMLYQLYALRFPYWPSYDACKHAGVEEVMQKVLWSDVPMNYGPWLKLSPAGRDFVSACMTRDYTDRITVADALAHPWFDQQLTIDDMPPPGASAGSSVGGDATGVGNNIVSSSKGASLPLKPKPQQPAEMQLRGSW